VQPVLTPAEMGAADERTIAAGTAQAVLMERAGHAVAWTVRSRLGATYGKRVVAVCGKGNNGGDGLIAARVLRGWGIRVDVFELADGVPAPAFERALRRADMLVDAMFGTGFRGALEGDAALVARHSAEIPTIAIDIPSGVDGLTGAVHGDATTAVATVTFAARKTGVCFEPGRSLAGEVTVADIGIDVGEATMGVVETADVRAWLPPRPGDANKWTAGLLVVGGSGGMTGAPIMASHAAMRAGAGIVWCGVPGLEAASRAGGTEVVVKVLRATPEGALAGLPTELRDALGRFRAAAIGPGLGTAEPTRAAVHELVSALTIPLVLDADGLNAFAGNASGLRGRPAPTVLTPHDGEYARLAGTPVGEDRVAAARNLAEVTECVVLLKGPGTVVAAPDGRAALETGGTAALATAGSGDVLTGIIGGLLTRGLDAFQAAAAGAVLHGLAADAAGHTGLVASDLVAALPSTLSALEP
jgi:ADP-dependent NAD(P)H-hydrate dehydratase / NAD(P)H-hydrate epimerase